ncbi:hypothetical protein HDU98_001988 [Podochytrium sp. JEL0797]|nr:hypothetical protein HDU98_001988 [Podochytrium sp. JEL0797]
MNPDPTSNPFYPLQGPPQNDEERQKLRDHIRDEQNATNALVQAKLSSPTSLAVTASQSCADLRWKYFECMRNRTGFARITSFCSAETKELENCVRLQTEFLTSLKYMNATTEAERESIAIKADRLYLDHKKE